MIDKSRFPTVEKLSGRTATLLLGTDAHIKEGTIDQEQRVGVTPKQIQLLIEWLREAGVDLRSFVVSGAGKRAGFGDEDYEENGSEIIQEDQLGGLTPRPDVVHALKEPCRYETTIPGPFIRIGALHTGDFNEADGLKQLLLKRNFCAIFDGSSVGDLERAPLMGSMSVFAGRYAAERVGEELMRERGKTVICGGGTVGQTAARELLSKYHDGLSDLLLIEENEKKIERLKKDFNGSNLLRFKKGSKIEPEDLLDAEGLIIGVRRRDREAPKVVRVRDLAGIRPGGVIVDPSIDEGGGIEGKTSEVGKEIELLGRNLHYYAEKNMPTRYPTQASEVHGDAALPYLGALLYLSARDGGPRNAVDTIEQHEGADAKESAFSGIMCDLRNGMAFQYFNHLRIISLMRNDGRHAVVRDVKEWKDFLRKNGLVFEDYAIHPCQGW